MNESIIDKIFKVSTEDNIDYECIFTCEEISSIKEIIDILKKENNNLKNELEVTINLIDEVTNENIKLKNENLDLKTNNLKLEKSNNLIEGVLLSSNKLELKIDFNKQINNISFYIELRLIKEFNSSNYVSLFSIISVDKKNFISLGWYNNKFRIDDNYGCTYYSKNECLLDDEWSIIFGILQISCNDMNIILELNKKKIFFSRFEKTKNHIESIYNNKNWNLIIGDSPNITKKNEIINIMFKKLIVIQDKLSFEEITKINYEQTQNSIYVDFTS
jgi:hypothetical protein